MPRISTAFVIDDIAPTHDPFWHIAGEKVHRQFWRVVVDHAKEAKVKELAEGRDRFGRKLIPITRYTRAYRRSAMVPVADANAPPLTPGDSASRAAAYFDGRAHANRAEFFWRNNFGRILHFHRVGARNRWAKSGRLPVRDVIGISPKSRRWVERKAMEWWSQYRHHLATLATLATPPATTPLPLVARGASVRARKKPVPVPIPQAPRPPLTLAPTLEAHHERPAPRVKAVKPLAELLQEMVEHEKTAGKAIVVKPKPTPKPSLRMGPAPEPKKGRLRRALGWVKGAVKRIFGG